MAENEFKGWLLDIYDSPQDGAVLWFICEDGQRRCLHQPFPVTFYAAGEAAQLRQLWRYLEAQPIPLKLSRDQRRDLFSKQPVTLLAMQAKLPADQARLFRSLQVDYPELTYYDADLPLSLRHAARYGTFPLAHCHVVTDGQAEVRQIDVLDSPWELDPPELPLRVLSIQPDADPQHTPPRQLVIEAGSQTYHFPLAPIRPLLVNLCALFERYDPDLLVTRWGDTWLLDWLIKCSEEHHLTLPLNRDYRHTTAHRPERSYFSYGQIVFRGQQVLLFGRWHIDSCNATLWDDYGLDGALEFARVTGLPVQTAARSSPGTGISSMQVLTALRQNILVPWHKQQVERPKTAYDLLHSDLGGLVYQPTIGLHRDVGEIDFVSMYPSIMVRFNISPETITPKALAPSSEPPGLVPQTLEPLLKKRLALKNRLAQMPAWHPERGREKARSSTHKWLLVTCFGYLGYKNARFGRIEAHEAVTAGGREALLRAKEVAEDQDFAILHMYVDGLWVARPGASRPADFQELLDKIAESTGLSISLDGVYRWVVFLPSRVDGRVPVPNRYFGVFQDGSIKTRGIEARRRDTAPFIARVQMELLQHFAKAQSADQLANHLPGAAAILRQRLAELNSRRVPLEELLVAQKLSREPSAYTDPSPAARAALQLQAVGKDIRPGQRVRFFYLRGEPDVHAWDLPDLPNPAALDIARYRTLLVRAAGTILQPMGMDENLLLAWVSNTPVDMPLLSENAALPSI
jgi:DNA polymerase-2